MTSIDSLSHKATHDIIKVTRWGKEVDVRWNDWLFATGKSDIPLAKVQLVFGTYPATINRLDTTFGEQSLKKIHILGVEAPKAPRYEFVDGEGDKDNDLFNIQGSRLFAKPSFNFEQKQNYSIRVKGIDPGELTLEKTFNINVLDLNDPPTAISLDNASVAENLKKGAIVGNLPPQTRTLVINYTFRLPSPDTGGNPDNAFFSLSGNQLRTAATLDFENRDQYNIRMQVTDSGGAVFEQDLLVQVTGSNDPPTLITLSAESVAEGLPIGHIVGNLSASDPDPGDSHTFRIAGGRDSKSFSIQSNQLRTAAILDRESKDTLEVTIRAIDAAKAYTDHTFYLLSTTRTMPRPQ